MDCFLILLFMRSRGAGCSSSLGTELISYTIGFARDQNSYTSSQY